MNYEKDIKIDELALDIEWLEQPSLMLKYSRHAVETRKILDKAKLNLDVVRARLDKKIRSNPEEYGLTKVVEAAVQNAILDTPEYLEAHEELLKAKYEAEVAKVVVQSIEQRKEALENLVRLHGLQYFAGPKVPRDLSKEMQRRHQQKQVDARVATAIRRRKRSVDE